MLTISRRALLKAVALGITGVRAERPAASAASGRELLYNGITLASPWPPRSGSFSPHPITPPYLVDPPAVIPIDVGRQLFVDDFLIEERALNRTYHRPEFHPGNPVLRPLTAWERYDDSAARTQTRSNPTAMVFSDGVFYDPGDRTFKMWYMGGYSQNTCLALSTDGIEWQRPTFDVVPGTNIVNAELRDSNTVWLDLDDPDRAARFKMASFNGSEAKLLLYTSPDGVHWKRVARSGPTGDRSTIFYNPFRQRWVFSLRGDNLPGFTGRHRRYWESAGFPTGATWSRPNEPVLWMAADRMDAPRSEYGGLAELYNLDAVGYESLFVGLFAMFRGERNDREKPNDICVGFSRDGFHWSRPVREPFIGVSEHVGDWNWANVQSAGGCCLIVGDRLYFYVSGRQGVPGTNQPGNCSTGLATLRRDGFASLNDDPDPDRPSRVWNTRVGQVTTRPIRFSGRHLFVNADVSHGSLRAEVLDRDGRVIQPFSLDRSIAVAGVSGTRLSMAWSGGASLEEVAGAAVRLRFSLTGGRLYAFWVSASPGGASGGYVAAGGPGFSRPTDV